MSHVHKLIDFTVAVYIVYDKKVLLIFHKKYDMWLPIGGHIELDEDPDEALRREIKEECGLEVNIYGSKPKFRLDSNIVKPLYPPVYMDIHRIDATHRHIKMVYFGISNSDKVKLNTVEHHQVHWFTLNELSHSDYNIREDDQFYAREALDTLRKSRHVK